MKEKMKLRGTRFEVDLGDVELPSLVAKRVESDIRSTVLTALARLDSGGIRKINWHIRDPWNGTFGMILDPRDPGLPDPLDSGGVPEIGDHEIILSAVMHNAVSILKTLDYEKGDTKPSGPEVLRAALKVKEIDARTRARIESVLEVVERIGGTEPNLSAGARKALKNVEQFVSGRPIAEQVRLLRSSEIAARVDDESVKLSLPYAARILEDGAYTIYSEDNPFFDTFPGPTPAMAKNAKIDGLKDVDYLGGIAGGAFGTAVPGIGTAAGAATIAASASGGYALAWVIDSVF